MCPHLHTGDCHSCTLQLNMCAGPMPGGLVPRLQGGWSGTSPVLAGRLLLLRVCGIHVGISLCYWLAQPCMLPAVCRSAIHLPPGTQDMMAATASTVSLDAFSCMLRASQQCAPPCRECEQYALFMKGKQDLDFTTDEEKEAVREIFEGALSGDFCLDVPEP